MTIAANKLITAEEFAAMAGDGLHELVRGEVVEVPNPKPEHGRYVSRLDRRLGTHVEAHHLGEVLVNDSGFILDRDPDTVRGPDISFIRRERLPNGKLPEGVYFPGPLDLAIEVLSPDDRLADVEDKIDLYLAAGCPLVVILNPKRRTATLHRPGVDPHIVREPELLDLSAIVADFRCALADIFG
jgi:Uma2 family endonuclease